jgi:hypothetical protein
MVWLDVTGSMGRIPEQIARTTMGTLMGVLTKHGVKDASVFFGAIGDHFSDRYPLQVGQFESETTLLDKWLTSCYLEGNGGGQVKESYSLAWLVAGRHTTTDAWEKRQQKGYLFTIGDEGFHPTISADWQRQHLGYGEASDVNAKELLTEASRMYHVFHIHCNDGYYQADRVAPQWKELLGERFLVLEDSSAVAELIASTVAVFEGAKLDDVTSNTIVSTALIPLTRNLPATRSADTGVVRF